MANRSSVVAGMSETIRRAGLATATVSPASSTTRVVPATVVRLPQAAAWSRSDASATRRATRIGMETAHPRETGWAMSGRGTGGPAPHRPSPEGVHGGASGEVYWLRAFARLPGFPVAS